MLEVGVKDERTRVLHLLPHAANGGATLQAMLLAEQLDRSLYDVRLVVGPGDRGEGNMINEMRMRGLQVEVVQSMRRAPGLLSDARATLELAELISRERPRIIHTHGSKPKLLAPLAAAINRGSLDPPPLLVAHLWGWEWQTTRKTALRLLYTGTAQVSAPAFDAIVACSEAMRSQGLQRAVGRPEQYHVVLPSLDLEQFRPDDQPAEDVRAELDIPPEAPVVGSVMRLAEQKAPEVLLRAASLLAPLFPDLRWLIVGGGPLEARVRRMIAELSLDGRVIMTGPRRDIPRLLQACDLFALSSAWEPFGIVFVEAAAMRLPVVCTAVDGTAEAIVDGQTGLLVPPNRPVALAAAIARLLSNPEMAHRMGIEGRRHAENFGIERFLGGIERLYERLLTGESASPR